MQVGPALSQAAPLELELDASWWANVVPGSQCNLSSSGGKEDAATTSSAISPPSAVGGGRLLVGGLELESASLLSRRGMLQDGEEARVAAALGYVAHITTCLSRVLDVPLRYPLLARGGRSAVVDAAPLHGAADERISGLLLPAQTPAGEGDGADGAQLVLPLHYSGSAGDRARFAYAVFLLNKDLEQLLAAHGLSSCGPNQLLANLYRLLAAAASGLPAQGGGWP